MVEIRVAVADATGVHALVRRLASVFDRSSVTFDGRRKEVRERGIRRRLLAAPAISSSVEGASAVAGPS